MNPTDATPDPVPAEPATPAKPPRKAREWGAVRRRGTRWYVRFNHDRREFERGPLTTWSAADKARRKARTLLEAGTPIEQVLSHVFGDFLGAALTFRDAIPHYLGHAKTRKKASTYAADVYRLKTAEAAPWAGKVLGRVEAADLMAWIATRQEATERMRLRKRRPDETAEEFQAAPDRLVKVKFPGASGSTINRDLAIVSAVFEWARKLRYVATNPTRDVEGFSEKGKERTVYLTAAESRALVAAATEPVRTFLLLALHTGMRRGELLSLKWQSVDLTRREVYIAAADEKAGRGRVVPMTAAVHTALAVLKASRPRPAIDGSDVVFTSAAGTALTVGDVRCGFEAAVVAADLPREKSAALCLHSLRHTAASLMVAAGIPLLDVARILGHSQLSVTMKYSHFAPESGRTAIDALGDALSGTPKQANRGGT